MVDLSLLENNIQVVTNYDNLISTPFHGEINAICWKRELTGDFLEIVNKIEFTKNMIILDTKQLHKLHLSEQGQIARKILLDDLELLKNHGASPTLNLIRYYERDDSYPFFPTDVYSFHVDRSPIPVDTFLCTYYGDSSEIIHNSQATQKIRIPEIRNELKKLYGGTDEGFETFLSEHFFDLHYEAKPEAQIISLGLGDLWKLAIDHPESKVPPCLHRAPEEKNGRNRLLLIC